MSALLSNTKISSLTPHPHTQKKINNKKHTKKTQKPNDKKPKPNQTNKKNFEDILHCLRLTACASWVYHHSPCTCQPQVKRNPKTWVQSQSVKGKKKKTSITMTTLSSLTHLPKNN